MTRSFSPWNHDTLEEPTLGALLQEAREAIRADPALTYTEWQRRRRARGAPGDTSEETPPLLDLELDEDRVSGIPADYDDGPFGAAEVSAPALPGFEAASACEAAPTPPEPPARPRRRPPPPPPPDPDPAPARHGWIDRLRGWLGD